MSERSEQMARDAGWTLNEAADPSDGLGRVSNFWWSKPTEAGVLRAESAEHALEIDSNPILRHFFHFPAWVI